MKIHIYSANDFDIGARLEEIAEDVEVDNTEDGLFMTSETDNVISIFIDSRAALEFEKAVKAEGFVVEFKDIPPLASQQHFSIGRPE